MAMAAVSLSRWRSRIESEATATLEATPIAPHEDFRIEQGDVHSAFLNVRYLLCEQRFKPK